MKKFLLVLSFILFLSACSQKPSVMWEDFNTKKLEEAKQAKMPVMIDFYADWCVACHELEDYTYTDSAVIKALDKYKRLQIDMTSGGTKEEMALVEKFNVEGLPTILFLDTEGNEIKNSRIEGFFAPQPFLKLLSTVSTVPPQPNPEPNAKAKV